MKTKLNKIMEVLGYFFTPEDSATPIHRGLISFDIKSDRIGLGSAKALFWVMNSMLLMYLITLL
ncbi:MAG: hypothetical protein KKE44_17350 [Proteobacteria bacterium]|nr:hypothetical protein [Pseudomonadota bacterium]MBU1584498.1 hypothetical protein [Pseudomonadota bacterium]MBU2630997.1 hypothetical protein [Pseudomonadota bacterium]